MNTFPWTLFAGLAGEAEFTSAFTLETITATGADVAVMDSGTAIAIYSTSSIAKIIAFTFDETGILTKGTAVTIPGGRGRVLICRLDATHAAISYANASGFPKYAPVTLSGTTTLAIGTEANSSGLPYSMKALSSTHFEAVWRLVTGELYVGAFEYTGTLIVGKVAAYVSNNCDFSTSPQLAVFDSQYSIVSFQENTTNDGRAVVCDYTAPMTLNVGNLYTYESTSVNCCAVATQSSTEAVVYWGAEARLLTRSGTSLSVGAVQTITDGGACEAFEFFNATDGYCALFYDLDKAMKLVESSGTITESGLSDTYTDNGLKYVDSVDHVADDYGVVVCRNGGDIVARIVHINNI